LKKGLTLIELIFTIVIISFVFTVIPKMLQVSNESLSFSSKEDALFNMYSQMMDIVVKEYDENNTKYDDILLSGEDSVLECNSSTGYRIGGFKGSRNCFNKVDESNIPSSPKRPFEALEDYNGLNYQISSGHKEYNLSVTVGYTDDNISYDYSSQKANFDFDNRSNNTKSNIKRVFVRIFNNDNNISYIVYDSANIGHAIIKSVLW